MKQVENAPTISGIVFSYLYNQEMRKPSLLRSATVASVKKANIARDFHLNFCFSESITCPWIACVQLAHVYMCACVQQYPASKILSSTPTLLDLSL